MAQDPSNISPFEPSRAAGERALNAFAPKMGLRYAQNRNVDKGAGYHDDVSMLSPYLRRRLVLEQDVVAKAVHCHGEALAEKFVQEVIWRGYFKGWMEHRPIIWDSYTEGLRRDLAALDHDDDLREAVERAVSGRTGLDYFDCWAEELIHTGYLHNHARMWFASIWIFSLGLPWRVGADFFLRHLLDGDPASNTLGWRWVAGLHTRGKPYPAQTSNIAKFSNFRFNPSPSDLAEVTEGLEGEEPNGLPHISPLRAPMPPDPRRPTVMLITEEDCRPDDFDPAALNLRGCATLLASHLRSPLAVSPLVVVFEQGALKDAASSSFQNSTELTADRPSDLAQWTARMGATQIVTPFIPTGPLQSWLRAVAPELDRAGIQIAEWRRDWDEMIWPYTTAGFFKVKKKIPSILRSMGIS